VSVERVQTSQLLQDLSGYRDERFVADFLGTTVETLRTWRRRRCGPPWVKFGKLVRYSIAGLIAWANSQPGGQAA
jgi:hypothetical protein